MKHLTEKYAQKLVSAGFADAGAPLVGGLDAEVTWNREDALCRQLEEVFQGLNINSLLFAEPAEPYRTIIDYLTRTTRDGAIYPNDCETRTFLHDLPVIKSFKPSLIINALKKERV